MLSNIRLRAAAGRSSMLEAIELTFYSISHAIQTSRKIKDDFDYAIIIALPLHYLLQYKFSRVMKCAYEVIPLYVLCKYKKCNIC